MNIPRYNRFRLILPELMLPNYIRDMYEHILKDADLIPKVYTKPVQCIAESITGVSVPGVHIKLVEQNRQDADKTAYVSSYWPKGNNAMRIIDDNELALTFRHVDGFFNYLMLRDAVQYMCDDGWQKEQGEIYKVIGDIVLENKLTDSWSVITTYKGVVYSSIDGNDFKYNKLASEESFSVRCKFTSFRSNYAYKGKDVSRDFFNHNHGN